MQTQYRTWAEIDIGAIKHNVKTIKNSLFVGTDLMACVKADAYGYGANVLCRVLEEAGVNRFGVATIEEALRLRKMGVLRPIQILGYTHPDFINDIYSNDITQTIVGPEHAAEMSKKAVELGLMIDVHIKADTGMHRYGFDCCDIEMAALAIKSACELPGLNVRGIFTHFAAADDRTDLGKDYTEMQHARFSEVISKLAQVDIVFETIHCCNSAGTVYYPEFQHDMVRVGIMLYGFSPNQLPVDLDLKPSVSLKTRITQKKALKAGESVSYGCTFKADRDMTIAVVPFGYADGYPRSMSNRGVGWIDKHIIHSVGTVCMDLFMYDITGVEANIGDVITIFGGTSPITFENIAGISGMLHYELGCHLTKRIPRVYMENGEVYAEFLPQE